MRPSSPPSTHVFEWLKDQETIVTNAPDPAFYNQWKLVTVPASEIDSCTSKWYHEKLKLAICVTVRCSDDTYEVAINRSYLSDLNLGHFPMNLDYNPTQPTQAQKDIYGICNATRRVRTPWLQRAAAWICSGRHQGVEGAYRDHARSNDLQEELARAILVQDISESALPVQEKLAQNLVLLFLNLEKDHNSYEYLERTHYDLLEDLRLSLSIPVPAKRTKRDEAQLTSLVRALLDLSGGRVDDQQQDFTEEYTASENTDLCASVLNITMTRHFGDFDSEEMCKILSKSPVFSGMTLGVRDLEKWTFKMTEYLHVEFPKDIREDGGPWSNLQARAPLYYPSNRLLNGRVIGSISHSGKTVTIE